MKSSKFWLRISLLYSLYYGFCFYYFVFNQEYLIQDDARQHVVWLQRFSDRELFPNDVIADYFSGLAPSGFKYLYFIAAKLGIEPVLFAKLLPPILALITTIYLYWFTLQILLIPLTGFISSVLINQLIWLNDDIVSSTARAFIYPLFAAFLYYLAKQNIIPCLIIMLLQGLFYPHILLIEMGVLSLRLPIFKTRVWNELTNKKQSYKSYIWWIAGCLVTAISLYPMTQKPPELATTVTAWQMRQMPEFNLGGRSPFFGVGWFSYWLTRSSGLSLALFPTIVWSSLLLPWLIKKPRINKLINSNLTILTQVIVASLTMFFLAHLLLPSLHLPSRYTYHTLRFALAIFSSIVLTIAIDKYHRWLRTKKQFNLVDRIKITLVGLFASVLVIVPAIPWLSINYFQSWQIGTAPKIYQYLARQPKDILVASLSDEVNNIPAFTQRSILVGGEFALAYHPAYYSQIEQRTVALLRSQYSSDLNLVKSFVQQYRIDYLLLDKDAFTPKYLQTKSWLINSSWSSETKKAIAQLESTGTPALQKTINSCSVVSTKTLNLLSGSCILKRS